MDLRRSCALTASLSFAVLSVGLIASSQAQGRQKKIPVEHVDQMMMFEESQHMGSIGVAQFRISELPLGTSQAPSILPHVGSHGTTLAADRHGLLVLDRELGQLIRSDKDGQVLASLDFERGTGEMVRDDANDILYVADRRANRIVRLRAHADRFERLDGAALREPHGLATSPDGKTLYATSVADHELVAFDTQTMMVRWRLSLAAEPRGVAVSADGTRAVVGFLTSGIVATIELGSSPNVDYLSMDRAQKVSDNNSNPFGFGFDGPVQQVPQVPPMTDSLADSQDIGLQFARNTYAVAYIGNNLAIAPHQLSTPHIPSVGFEDTGTYGGGGGFTAPITHRMAMIDAEDSFAPAAVFAEIGLHQPRAIAYDGGSDTLYLAGYGNDQIMAVAEVSQSSVHLTWVAHVPSTGTTGCGPDGLTFHDGELYAHCELDRSLVRVDLTDAPIAHNLGSLGASTRSAPAQRGADLFRRGLDARVSVGGFMACASCHPEGRTDGLSWRIEGHNLQTPLLAGRVAGTHPFKWDGQDKDLPTSLSNTVGRLGGSGLSPSEVQDLEAFLKSLPAPVPPTSDAAALTRGRALFESDETGCVNCHDGPQFADGMRHDLKTNIGDVDTPSLIGLAYTAPYYHDGSARTLRALLTDKASVHDMGETAHLDNAQLEDLIAYLESL